MPQLDPIRKAVTELRRERSRLEAELQRIDTAIAALGRAKGARRAANGKSPRPRKMSAAGRAAISRAAKKRWAQYRAARRKKGA
jgi:hypothetical protein